MIDTGKSRTSAPIEPRRFNTREKYFHRSPFAYLFQMLVHPFGKCFLLDRVSFVCNHRNQRFVSGVDGDPTRRENENAVILDAFRPRARAILRRSPRDAADLVKWPICGPDDRPLGRAGKCAGRYTGVRQQVVKQLDRRTSRRTGRWSDRWVSR